MSKIVRYEFPGSRWVSLLYCLSLIGIPFAVLYLLGWTAVVHKDLENPTEFLEQWRGARGKTR